MFVDDLDLDGLNPQAVEAVAESGGLIPAGKYHARLEGVAEVTSRQKGTPGTELHFTILAGPHAGREVKDTLWAGDSEIGKNRRVLFAHRLGLLAIDPKTKRYVAIDGRTGLEDCIGAEVVIEVRHEPDQKDPEKKWARLGFAVWAVDDPKVKDVPKAGRGKPVNKAKFDTSDL